MLKLHLLSILSCLLILYHGSATRCGTSIPTVRQVQVGFRQPLVFRVVVQNSCSMCPAIDVHVRCGGFPQSLASPRLIRVVGFNDCVVNDGLPLAPLQIISFNYTYQSRFTMSLRSWYYQCE